MTWEHGLSKYRNEGCRCKVCRAAFAQSHREQRARRKQKLDQAKHGTVTTYINWGCRCEECTEAHALYLRERYHNQRLPSASDGR